MPRPRNLVNDSTGLAQDDSVRLDGGGGIDMAADTPHWLTLRPDPSAAHRLRAGDSAS